MHTLAFLILYRSQAYFDIHHRHRLHNQLRVANIHTSPLHAEDMIYGRYPDIDIDIDIGCIISSELLTHTPVHCMLKI